jgi:hypothetical protein
MRYLITSFGGGEFSPLLEGRTDLNNAATGCRRIRNMLPRGLGGAFQRPGFLLAGMSRLQNRKTRLIPFTFNAATTYRIELGHYYARFWLSSGLCIHPAGVTGTQYLSAPGEPLVLATPWSEDEVPEVQISQANDVIWLAHGSYWPRQLLRLTEQHWNIQIMPVAFPPLRDPNDTATTMAASGVTGNITLTASTAVFDPGDVGGYYELAPRRQVPYVELPLTANGVSTELRVNGKWEVATFGNWSGVLYLERKTTSGTWEIARTWRSLNDLNVSAVGENATDTSMRFTFAATATTTGTMRAQLTAVDATVKGLVKVTGYTSPTVVTGTVMKEIHSTAATTAWTEGAWSTRRGFPRAVTLHGQRLIFAGTSSQRQAVWGSGVNSFDNFERTSLADSGFLYEIAASQSNAIVWLSSQKGLLIGTEGDEWIMDGGGNGEPLSAIYVRAERRSSHGSASQQSLLIGSAVIFVQAGAKILNEYLFNNEQQGYEAIELSELAEHLADEQIVQVAYAQSPHSIIWCVTAAGSLLSLTYKRRNQVLAWAKHSTPFGVFESVCCTPGAGGVHEVWVTIRRQIGLITYRSVERMDPGYWDQLKAGNTTQLCVGDGAVRLSGAPVSTVGGLNHLEGAMVQVLTDGALHEARRVTGGQITLAVPASDVVVGLAPAAELQPMPLEFQMDTGSSAGRRFRVVDVDLRLWQAGGAPMYADSPASDYYAMNVRGGQVSVPTLFTGQLKLPVASRHNASTTLSLKNETMLPLNCLSLVMQVAVDGA